jgi:hypothetical protein
MWTAAISRRISIAALHNGSRYRKRARGIHLIGHQFLIKPPSQRAVVVKRGYRVRLNGADHQWGKDPLKEVVG